MDIQLDAVRFTQIFLAMLRIGVLFVLTPIFSNLSGLVTVRVLLTLALGFLLGSSLAPPAAFAPLALGALLSAALAEVVTGAVLSFGVFAAFGAFSLAGKILDIQSGFSIGSVYDPVTRHGAPVFATLLNLAGVVLFFALDAHQALLRGLAFSLQQAPPGTGIGELNVDAIVRQFGMMFTLGVTMAGPVMFCLLLAEVGLAVMSRTLPQMNAFVIGVPVKIVIALAVLTMTIGALGPAMGHVYASIFAFWTEVLH